MFKSFYFQSFFGGNDHTIFFLSFLSKSMLLEGPKLILKVKGVLDHQKLLFRKFQTIGEQPHHFPGQFGPFHPVPGLKSEFNFDLRLHLQQIELREIAHQVQPLVYHSTEIK